MGHIRPFFACLLALLSVAACGGRGQPVEAPPDLILYNGRIFTANATQPHAQALAIRGERILAVGSDAEILALAAEATQRIDLQGHPVIPGINDAHEHLTIWPADTVMVDTGSLNPEWDALRPAIVDAAGKADAGSVIRGSIFGKAFHDTRLDRSALDAAAAAHPVVLGTVTGHAGIYNSRALDALGIDEDVADPMGGRYERDASGRLTGVLREYADWEASRRAGALVPDAVAVAQLRQQLEQRARLGITSTQTMPVATDVARMAALLAQADPAIRVRVISFNTTTPDGRAPYVDVARHNPTPMIEVSGQKWIVDGVGLEGSLTPRDQAHLHAHDPQGPFGPGGLPVLLPQAEIEALLRESLQRDEQVLVHVFGRPGAAAMLDAMDATGGAEVWANRRLRFEHADGLLDDLVPRARALGVVVSQQGSHLDASMFEDPAFGKRLGAGQLLRSLLDAGIPLALGSDGPPNPYVGILLASLHPNRPDEAITREQAVIAYTMGSAYAQFAEDDKGSLEPGKLADLAVLSQDIFSVPPEALPGTTSRLTLVGGKVAWRDPEF